MKYELHSACAMWPQMPELELKALTADIRMNGLRQPVILHDGMILDGRNRAIACERAGVELITEIYKGTDHLGFVVSANLHRRHLSTTERAEIAAKMANMKVGGKAANSAKLQNCATISVEAAAKLMGVSPRSVHTARARGKSITRPTRLTPAELQASGLSPHTDRYRTSDGQTATRVKWMNDEIKAAQACIAERDHVIAERDREIAQLKSDLEALQTGNLMQMSRVAIEQRRTLIEKMKTKRERSRCGRDSAG